MEIAEGTRPLTSSYFSRIMNDPVLKQKGIKGQYLLNKVCLYFVRQTSIQGVSKVQVLEGRKKCFHYK